MILAYGLLGTRELSFHSWIAKKQKPSDTDSHPRRTKYSEYHNFEP